MTDSHSALGELRYRYPSPEAEFTLYNFHAQSSVDELADALSSTTRDSPRIIQLFGDPGSGRYYFLRAAAFHASQRGTPIDVEKLDLEGYDPDTSLKSLIVFLATRNPGTAGEKLAELGRRTKVEVKTNPINLIFATLSVKTDLSVDEVLHFLQSDESTPGPRMSPPEMLGQFLNRLTKGRRLVLHLPKADTIDVSLLRHLVEETRRRTDFFISLAYPYQSPAANKLDRNAFPIELLEWTREEVNRAFVERFAPNAISSDFLDFAWASDQTTHSRETFAKLLLRLVTHDWLTVDDHGTWTIEKDWRNNQELAAEFSRDLLEPINDIKSRLENSGTSQNQIWQLDDFIDAAPSAIPPFQSSSSCM